MNEFQQSLPIHQYKQEIVQTIVNGGNQVTILCSATGSGKSTQIPQYLYKAIAQLKRITITQPRRVAAISIATRVADEVVSKLGDLVGYCVRFQEKATHKTRIRYVTDGIAVREALLDKTFSKDSVFIVDEAHERSVQTDLLFGLLKQCLLQNKQLKVVIMSATIDARFFANYFSTDQVLFIQGRAFPIRHHFLPKNENNYLEAIGLTIMQIHKSSKKGDILVFLPGEREIHIIINTVQIYLEQEKLADLELLPLFANLSNDDQMKIFTPNQQRRCICATNIAETSLTVPNIAFVVDSGFVRQKIYDPSLQIWKLVTIPTSRSSIAQRCGRAGRLFAGDAFHIYLYQNYEKLQQQSIPEILRCDLAPIFITIVGCGISKLLDFQFINQPDNNSKRLAIKKLLLYKLIQITEQKEFSLSELGQHVVSLPLEIDEALCILKALEYKNRIVVKQVIQIISILNCVEQFFSYNDQDTSTNRNQFRNPLSDHLMLLNILTNYNKSDNQQQFCKKYGIQQRTLQQINLINSQVYDIVSDKFLKDGDFSDELTENQNIDDILIKCIAYGFKQNIARIGKDDRSYEREGLIARIHPSSGVKYGQILLFHQIVQTTDVYMRIVTVLKEEQIE